MIKAPSNEKSVEVIFLVVAKASNRGSSCFSEKVKVKANDLTVWCFLNFTSRKQISGVNAALSKSCLTDTGVIQGSPRSLLQFPLHISELLILIGHGIPSLSQVI